MRREEETSGARTLASGRRKRSGNPINNLRLATVEVDSREFFGGKGPQINYRRNINAPAHLPTVGFPAFNAPRRDASPAGMIQPHANTDNSSGKTIK